MSLMLYTIYLFLFLKKETLFLNFSNQIKKGKFSLETKEEQKPPSAEPKEEKKPEFSNLTAEEKLEQEKTQNVEDKSKSEEEAKKKAEAQRKADEIKANLFNTDQDLFKD